MSGLEDDSFAVVTNPDATSSTQPEPASNAKLLPIRSEISSVLSALQALWETASFVSTLGGDTIVHAAHHKLLEPIGDLLEEVSSVDRALRTIGSGNAPFEDEVYDKDLLFKWTSDCNTCVLGFQAKLEDEAQRMTEWMEHGETQLANEAADDEWTVLEKDEAGNISSGPLREAEKPSENGDAFKPDENWELGSYAQQLNWLREDLASCVPYLRRFTPPTWNRHRNGGRRSRPNQGEGLSWYAHDLDV